MAKKKTEQDVVVAFCRRYLTETVINVRRVASFDLDLQDSHPKAHTFFICYCEDGREIWLYFDKNGKWLKQYKEVNC